MDKAVAKVGLLSFALMAALVTTGCGASRDETALGGKVTETESQALQDAANMLEAARPKEGERAPDAAK